jgi:hypothetical protein
MKRVLATVLIAGVGMAPMPGAWAQKYEGLAATPWSGWA